MQNIAVGKFLIRREKRGQAVRRMSNDERPLSDGWRTVCAVSFEKKLFCI